MIDATLLILFGIGCFLCSVLFMAYFRSVREEREAKEKYEAAIKYMRSFIGKLK